MKYSVDKTGSDPAYMQLYRQLREDILSGALSAGTRLPSKRLLAGELSVSVITVEHAYALLVDEGYARSRQRSGFFVSFGAAGRFGSPGYCSSSATIVCAVAESRS